MTATHTQVNDMGEASRMRRQRRQQQQLQPSMEEFLSASSIHGLRYLRKGGERGGLSSRLLWLAAVLCSASAAALIIFLNVRDWRGRPAVVTSVDWLDVEGEIK